LTLMVTALAMMGASKKGKSGAGQPARIRPAT
jgi:hypothetical protein